jgi:2'-5' RNA ligase
MGYKKKQAKIFQEMEKAFKKGVVRTTIVEMMANYAHDDQVCLTNVCFIPKPFTKTIQEKIIKPLKKADASQYFYPSPSLHITVQGIRTIHKPPIFNQTDIKKVKKAFSEIIPHYSPINFEIQGILELPTSLFLKVFPDKKFQDLVLKLRKILEKIGLPDDKVYFSKNIVLANISFCRYTQTPNQLFKKQVKKLKNVKIGQFKANKIHLITTNAVCHPGKTVIIKTFNLGERFKI